MDLIDVIANAEDAKANGAQRFCMGAAWRELKDRDLSSVCAMSFCGESAWPRDLRHFRNADQGTGRLAQGSGARLL
jgi:biotin synthase